MANPIKLLIEIGLVILLVWFGLVSYNWIKTSGFSDATSVIALASIVYAVFTSFMFWNMKSSSEAQVRPLLFTSLKENMDLKISNKMSQNVAKDVKVRLRALPIKKSPFKSKKSFLFHKYFWRLAWSFPRDYTKSYKENFEIWDKDKSLSLSNYIAESLYKGTNWATLITTNANPKEGEIHFKLLIQISYESLLDAKYFTSEFYLVSKTPHGTKIHKNPAYH